MKPHWLFIGFGLGQILSGALDIYFGSVLVAEIRHFVVGAVFIALGITVLALERTEEGFRETIK